MPYCIGIEMDSTYMYSLISCKQQIKQKYIVAPALYNTKLILPLGFARHCLMYLFGVIVCARNNKVITNGRF